MTESATRHGRPSVVHEDRAHTLAAMATLAGYVIGIDALPDGSRPDVLRVRPGDDSLFVGDAKATETAGNVDTATRLARYVSFLIRYRYAGGSGAMALAVSPADRYGWLRVLRDLCGPLEAAPVAGNVDVVDDRCAIVWQTFSPGVTATRSARVDARRVRAEGLDEVSRVAYSPDHVRSPAPTTSGD